MMKACFAGMLALTLLGLTLTANASEPAGTWKSQLSINGQTLDRTLQLSVDSEGDWVSGFDRDGATGERSPITEGKYGRGGEIKFKVTQEVAGQKVVVRYGGSIVGDTINGTGSIDYGDRSQPFTWTAQRQR